MTNADTTRLIYDRCRSDKDFRESFLKDPAKILRDAGIQNLPEKIVAIDMAANTLTIPLSPFKGMGVPVSARQSNETEQEAMARVMNHAAADMDFRQKLLADPRNVLESEGVKVDVPQDVRLVFLETEPGAFTIPVPPLEV